MFSGILGSNIVTPAGPFVPPNDLVVSGGIGAFASVNGTYTYVDEINGRSRWTRDAGGGVMWHIWFITPQFGATMNRFHIANKVNEPISLASDDVWQHVPVLIEVPTGGYDGVSGSTRGTSLTVTNA